MLVVDSFGKNIYMDGNLIGYIGENVLFINGHKFADLLDDGTICYGKLKVGYVDEDGSIIVKDKEVGYIDQNGNFVFYKIFQM